MHRFVRLRSLTAPSTVAARPPRRCDSRTTRMTCLSFISRVKPTPESQPLECNDGTDVSRLFKFLSNEVSVHNLLALFNLDIGIIVKHTDCDVVADCIGRIDFRVPSDWNWNWEQTVAVAHQCIHGVVHYVGHCVGWQSRSSQNGEEMRKKNIWKNEHIKELDALQRTPRLINYWRTNNELLISDCAFM